MYELIMPSEQQHYRTGFGSLKNWLLGIKYLHSINRVELCWMQPY